jgi:hypothetical protein
MRRNGGGNEDLDRAMEGVFATMVKHGLRRDQNVFAYSLLANLRPSAAARALMVPGIFNQHHRWFKIGTTPWPEYKPPK